MRLKTSTVREREHKALCSTVAWVSADEVLSAADDHQLILWNLVTNKSTVVNEFGNLTPTFMHLSSNNLLVMGCAEGKLLLLSRNGQKLDKSVDAHHGACLIVKWSPDNSSIVTGGEDGSIKIWSKSLLLRNTLAQNTTPVYTLAWSSDGQQIVFASDKLLTIQSLQPGNNSRPVQWKAHEGLVLSVDWSQSGHRIASGAEDCRYRIWDEFGRLLYNSNINDAPLTSVSWSPSGQLLGVGAFNTLRLCDVLGWSHSLNKPKVGSLLQLTWSGDSTQVAAACGSGHVLFAHVVDRRLDNGLLDVVVNTRKSADIHNVLTDAHDNLEFRDRVVLAELNAQHLVIVTTAQTYIYSTSNLNTPIIMELKGSPVALVLNPKHFLLVSSTGLHIFAYDGRLVSNPKSNYVRSESLAPHALALSNDCLAVIDSGDGRRVFLFDVDSGKALNDNKPLMHRQEVQEVALDQSGGANQRKLAIVDRNRDLFIRQVRQFGVVLNANSIKNSNKSLEESNSSASGKLASMVESMLWSDEANILVTIQDGRLCLHTCPLAVFLDRELLPKSTVLISATEMSGGNLVSWTKNVVTVRKADGALVSHSLPPYAVKIHQYMNSGHYKETIRLARFVNEISIWACVAALALDAKHLETAEIAYAALQQPDKVHYLRYIRDLPIRETREAELSLLKGNFQDAENILLQNKRIFRAILLNVHLHRWQRALELALKHNLHVDTVLAYRAKYLSRHDDGTETIKGFVDVAKDVEVDFEKVAAAVEKELDNERAVSEHQQPRRASHIEIM